MLVDYFLIRRGNLTLEDLYTRSSWGRYHYFRGFNVRAFAAFIIGFILPLPGFAGSFGHSVGDAADHMFSLGWVLSFLMGGVSYFIACTIFKVPGDDGKHPFESKVEESQGIINGEVRIDGQLREKESRESQMSRSHTNSEPSKEAKLNGAMV